jgi:hypothetical protein
MWGLVKDAGSLAAPDDFHRTVRRRAIVGPPARTKREELARLARVETPQPVPQPLSGAAPLTAPKTGESFKDCAGCPEMVVVPAGKFTMGSQRQWCAG